MPPQAATALNLRPQIPTDTEQSIIELCATIKDQMYDLNEALNQTKKDNAHIHKQVLALKKQHDQFKQDLSEQMAHVSEMTTQALDLKNTYALPEFLKTQAE